VTLNGRLSVEPSPRSGVDVASEMARWSEAVLVVMELVVGERDSELMSCRNLRYAVTRGNLELDGPSAAV